VIANHIDGMIVFCLRGENSFLLAMRPDLKQLAKGLLYSYV